MRSRYHNSRKYWIGQVLIKGWAKAMNSTIKDDRNFTVGIPDGQSYYYTIIIL